MDFTLPVMKFIAEQTPENTGPRYRPMRRKRIEPKSQEQTPQNIKNERRRQRFRELMNMSSSSQSGVGTSGVENFANSPQREQNNESTVSRGSVRLFSDSTEDSVVNSSVEGNQEPCSFDLLESQPEMPYSTQDRINQNQVTESQVNQLEVFLWHIDKWDIWPESTQLLGATSGKIPLEHQHLFRHQQCQHLFKSKNEVDLVLLVWMSQ